jgi:hypothetical protein
MTMEALLIAAAALAAGGAVVAGVLAFRGRRPTDDPGSIRRAPSPSSVGLADDPIVAGMGVDGDGRTRLRHTERIDPPI